MMLKKEAIDILEEYLAVSRFSNRTWRDLPPPVLERVVNKQLAGKHIRNLTASEETAKIAISDYLSKKRWKAGYRLE